LLRERLPEHMKAEHTFREMPFDVLNRVLEVRTDSTDLLEIDLFHAILVWANIPSRSSRPDGERHVRTIDGKYDDALKLLNKIEIKELTKGDIEYIWMQGFITENPLFTDSIFRRVLGTSVQRNFVRPSTLAHGT